MNIRKAALIVAGAALSGIAYAAPKPAEIAWQKLKIDEKTELEYALALPDAKVLKAGCPLVVVLPGGAGAKGEVEGAIGYFADEGTARGWIVVSPMAPNGKLFFQEGEKALEPLVKYLKETYRVEEGQVHVAGVSNGGIGAFHALIQHPGLWASVLTLPGAIQSEEDIAKLADLKGKPITMYAGEKDELGYQEGCRKIAQALDAKKVPYTFNLRKGEGHIMPIPPAALMDDLERHRKAVKAAAKDPPKGKKK